MNLQKTHTGMHINLFLEGRRCLVIGGGKVAFHKTELLLEAQAIVHVISPELTDEFKRLVELNLVTYEPREFEVVDATNATLTQKIVAGLICASVGVTIGNPLEVVKVRL